MLNRFLQAKQGDEYPQLAPNQRQIMPLGGTTAYIDACSLLHSTNMHSAYLCQPCRARF